jgi:hypothetical protein
MARVPAFFADTRCSIELQATTPAPVSAGRRPGR